MVTTASKTFPLDGLEYSVPASLDLFNSYRLMFREIAQKCKGDAEVEYSAKVHNLDSFLLHFTTIYNFHLQPIIQKSIDILISESIWTETIESFCERHHQSFHLALDIYNSANAGVQQIDNAMTNTIQSGFNVNKVGTVFAPKGQLGSAVRSSQITNSLYDVAGKLMSSFVKKSNINRNQYAKVYECIDKGNLFYRMECDYWNVFLVLVDVLRQNGREVWFPSAELTQQSKNIFNNLSNPFFPQEKILEAFLQIITANPYNEDYYTFFISKFGETEEIISIKNYFGY